MSINSDPTSLTMEEIEQNGVPPGVRFITVSGAPSNGDYYFSELQKSKTIMEVFTPQFSSQRLQTAVQEKLQTSLFYKTRPNRACMTSRNCVQAGPVLELFGVRRPVGALARAIHISN